MVVGGRMGQRLRIQVDGTANVRALRREGWLSFGTRRKAARAEAQGA